VIDEIKILRCSWWLPRRTNPLESTTFERSNSSHITSTFKQERDKAAKEGRQGRAGKGSLQFIHEGQTGWDFVVGGVGVGVKYVSPKREAGTQALSARPGDDRPGQVCRPLGFRTSFRWPSWSKMPRHPYDQDVETRCCQCSILSRGKWRSLL
jgi:hypothetical protein